MRPLVRGYSRAAFKMNPGHITQGDMTVTINECMALLVAELTEGEVPAPVSQSFTLGNIWADLCRIADEALPRDVANVLDRPIGYVPVAGPLSPMGEHALVYAD